MKTFKKIIPIVFSLVVILFILLIVCFVLLFSYLESCNDNTEKLNRIKQVQSEVSYGYTAYDGNSFMKDGEIYYFQELAYKIIGKKCKNYIYDGGFTENYKYFFYEYGSHKNYLKNSDGKRINFITSDVALFCVDMENISCKLVYDFKNVYPIGYKGSQPDIGDVLDENRMLLHYNGIYQILDLQSGQIVYSAELYEKEDYVNYQSIPFQTDFSHNFYRPNGAVLEYYEIDGYSIKKHLYTITPDCLISRTGNYIYTFHLKSGSGSSLISERYEFFECYDLTNGNEIELSVLIDRLQEEWDKSHVYNEKEKHIVDGKMYYFEHLSDFLKIYDENQNLIVTIDENFMRKNSPVFNDLYDLWVEKHDKYELFYFEVLKEKLFVRFDAKYSMGRTTPVYVYEYDIKNNQIFYVGFFPGDRLFQFNIVHAKTVRSQMTANGFFIRKRSFFPFPAHSARYNTFPPNGVSDTRPPFPRDRSYICFFQTYIPAYIFRSKSPVRRVAGT